MSQIYYNNLQEGFDALRNTNTKLVADRNYLRKENDVLHIKLSKYEVDLANDRRRGEEENARVRQASAVYEKQRHALKQVENLLETPLSSTAFSGGDNVSNVAQIRKRFDRNDPEVRKSSRNRNASRPAVSKVPSAASHSARIDTTSFMNQRFHRRSKSAAPSTGGRVLDHQAAKKVPTGTIFQPALPSNTRHTTQPSTKDLRKSTDYVLNKQVVDSKGNLRTDLYKVCSLNLKSILIISTFRVKLFLLQVVGPLYYLMTLKFWYMILLFERCFIHLLVLDCWIDTIFIFVTIKLE